MIDLPTESLPVKRYAAGSWSTGNYVKGVLSEFSIEASVQPMKYNDTMLLPEHRRSEESLKFYTETKVGISDEKNNLPADEITHDGKIFQVMSVANWSIGTDIPHYKVICLKKNDEGGGNAPR